MAANSGILPRAARNLSGCRGRWFLRDRTRWYDARDGLFYGL